MPGCIRIAVSGRIEYRCPFCGLTFRSEDECRDHVIAEHTKSMA
ncbi:hypothetical protein [Thermoplasma acidophilum]|nr:hypothetical protein [Thermoplasma acidophilum]MCY0851596.1 hypothetical protein [Thermoplasma acidophilum]